MAIRAMRLRRKWRRQGQGMENRLCCGSYAGAVAPATAAAFLRLAAAERIVVSGVLRWLAMLLPFALWGTGMVAMKPLLSDLSPLTLAWLRILPAAWCCCRPVCCSAPPAAQPQRLGLAAGLLTH